MGISARFRRDIGALSEVFDFVGSFFADQQLDERFRFPVDLALEEVFTNMVRHSGGTGSEIEVSLRRRDNELMLSLTDPDADPFDLTASPEVDVSRPLSERIPGGLGIHLIRKMMDRVEYEHHDRESRVTLYKRLV
jgi:anti-sigma regulatory factor (Ser/Thr protein kinase)